MTGLRKMPQDVLRKTVALIIWIRGRDDIEENSKNVWRKMVALELWI